MNLRQSALGALLLCTEDEKRTAVKAMPLADHDEELAPVDRYPSATTALPGRNARPPLVQAAQLAKRSVHTATRRAALIHSLAHIEPNAVNFGFNEYNVRFFKLTA